MIKPPPVQIPPLSELYSLDLGFAFAIQLVVLFVIMLQLPTFFCSFIWVLGPVAHVPPIRSVAQSRGGELEYCTTGLIGGWHAAAQFTYRRNKAQEVTVFVCWGLALANVDG